MQATAIDPGNAAIRSFFADTYSDLAQADATLATSRSIAAEESRKHWKSARDLYARSLEIWQDLQRRNTLAPADKGKKDAVLKNIAACDAALH